MPNQPPMPNDFEEQLRKKLDDKSTSGEILFKLYNDYVKYVGKLDALPDTELGYYDIRGPNGKIMPFSKWPTKSTRAFASKVWDQYNVNLQSGAPSEEDKEMDPCEDPEFLSELLDACVRTSIRMGVDRRVAFKQCSRQVEKMIHAIRIACEGRGLVPEKQKEFLDNALELLGEVAGKPVKLNDLTPEDRALFDELVNAIGYQSPREF